MTNTPLSAIAREADHRIANSLTIISALVRTRAAAASVADDPTTFLLEIADRIETVASLHRLVTQSESDLIELGAYLAQICNRLGRGLGRKPADIKLSCPSDCVVPFGLALSLGLITAELFSNSLKYAHPTGLPTMVSISCERRDGSLTLDYEDDGVGYPEHFDLSTAGNLGVRFIRGLVEQMRGVDEWNSDPLGIRFQLRVQDIALGGQGDALFRKDRH
jgi:two-component sensor histidine kinase